MLLFIKFVSVKWFIQPFKRFWAKKTHNEIGWNVAKYSIKNVKRILYVRFLSIPNVFKFRGNYFISFHVNRIYLPFTDDNFKTKILLDFKFSLLPITFKFYLYYHRVPLYSNKSLCWHFYKKFVNLHIDGNLCYFTPFILCRTNTMKTSVTTV